MRTSCATLCLSMIVLAGCNQATQETVDTQNQELEKIVGSGIQQITINVPGMT